MAMMKGPRQACVECGNDYAVGYCTHLPKLENKKRYTKPVSAFSGELPSGEPFRDNRTDAEVQAAVDKASGDHYEMKDEDSSTFHPLNPFHPKVIRGLSSEAEKDRPVACNASHWSLRTQIKDYYTNFYGPSPCDGCGQHDVVRSETGKGFPVTSWNERECKGGVEYTPHHCTHLRLFKGLAGKVLTVIDASLTTNPKQHKAVCDLLRKAFAETISKARELEGDNSGESVGREELA